MRLAKKVRDREIRDEGMKKKKKKKKGYWNVVRERRVLGSNETTAWEKTQWARVVLR